MSYSFDPNRNPFSRNTFARTYEIELDTHPLERKRLEPFFKERNPRGYQHDLGAADVFLDNFGLLFKEQADEVVWADYQAVVRHFLFDRWRCLKDRVLAGRPWWGEHFNRARQRANAGGPKGLLRLLEDEELRLNGRWAGWASEENGQDSVLPMWPPAGLVPTAGRYGVRPPSQLPPGGLLSDVIYPSRVEDIRVLPPRESTPDLPARVGMTEADRVTYSEVCRDQGSLGTCGAHAVAMALDVLVRRQRKEIGFTSAMARSVHFSPAWIHCASGTDRAGGRSLASVVQCVSKWLPCSEGTLPYPKAGQEEAWVANHEPWETAPVRMDSENMTAAFGVPHVVRIQCDRIGRIKTYLAAGWVVVLGTHVTDEFLWSPGLQHDGLPLAPLPGHTRTGGHGWVLVGYDHVDGNHQWKYQGRFFALSSWGRGYPQRPLAGPGVFTLPFAMLLSEGIDAYALRFRAN